MDIKVEIKAEPFESLMYSDNNVTSEFTFIKMENYKNEEDFEDPEILCAKEDKIMHFDQDFRESFENDMQEHKEMIVPDNVVNMSDIQKHASLLKLIIKGETEFEHSGKKLLFRTLRESRYPIVLVKKLNLRKEKSLLGTRVIVGNYDDETLKSKDFLVSERRTPASSSDQIFSCSICGFSTDVRKDFGLHLLDHSNWMKCSECDYRTIERENLKQHILTHTNLQILKCSVCGYETKNEDQLRRHEFTHSKAKLLKCARCTFSTIFNDELRIHVQNHNDKNMLPCSKCTYKTKDKKKLKVHLSKHSRLISCPECNFKTDASSRLKTHSAVHAKAKLFQCSKCNFETNHKVSLKTHKLTHSNSKLYKCSKCSYQTNYKGNFKNHLQTPHPNFYSI